MIHDWFCLINRPQIHTHTGLFWSKSQILFHTYIFQYIFIKSYYKNNHHVFITYKMSTVVFCFLKKKIRLKYPYDSKLLFHYLFNSWSKQGPKFFFLLICLLSFMWSIGFCFPWKVFVEETGNFFWRDYHSPKFCLLCLMSVLLNLSFVFLHGTLLLVDKHVQYFLTQPPIKAIQMHSW